MGIETYESWQMLWSGIYFDKSQLCLRFGNHDKVVAVWGADASVVDWNIICRSKY